MGEVIKEPKTTQNNTELRWDWMKMKMKTVRFKKTEPFMNPKIVNADNGLMIKKRKTTQKQTNRKSQNKRSQNNAEKE